MEEIEKSLHLAMNLWCAYTYIKRLFRSCHVYFHGDLIKWPWHFSVQNHFCCCLFLCCQNEQNYFFMSGNWIGDVCGECWNEWIHPFGLWGFGWNCHVLYIKHDCTWIKMKGYTLELEQLMLELPWAIQCQNCTFWVLPWVLIMKLPHCSVSSMKIAMFLKLFSKVPFYYRQHGIFSNQTMVFILLIAW